MSKFLRSRIKRGRVNSEWYTATTTKIEVEKIEPVKEKEKKDN